MSRPKIQPDYNAEKVVKKLINGKRKTIRRIVLP